MSFANALERLRASLTEPSRGMRDAGAAVVRRDDLRELLHHFDRLDTEARGAHWITGGMDIFHKIVEAARTVERYEDPRYRPLSRDNSATYNDARVTLDQYSERLYKHGPKVPSGEHKT